MAELKKALGTCAEKTVYRKLKALSYRSSYSHRGRFYTLDEIVSFDDQGLWSHNSVRFSKYGTLLKTVKAFVEQSERGYAAYELEAHLNVQVKESLLHLFVRGKIFREKVSNVFIYVASKPSMRKGQIRGRKSREDQREVGLVPTEPQVLAHELQAAIILFFSRLHEKQRRLYAGLESMRLGYGGDRKIAELLDVDVHTVATGRKELLDKDSEVANGAIRSKGGGRSPVKKKSQK